MAADEIERFRREIVEREGNRRAGESITGWDANTVTHVLGIRAFQTQLLCEQVIGRALRRQSYDLNDEGLEIGV